MSDEGRSPGSHEDASPGPPRRLDPDRAAAASKRLDPDRAASAQSTPGPPGRPGRSRAPRRPVVDTRRYQRLIGLIGVVLVIVISVSFLTTHRAGTAGVPAGQQLPYFAAPLAVSTLNGDANTNPPCTLARHDPRALNVCLLAKRAPLVLGFFVTGSGACERQVTAMQDVSRQFPGVQFAAVAVRASHRSAGAAVRAHHWTIPVAYDLDGAVGAMYGIEVCPIVELVRRGGVVARRLIGEHWDTSAELTPQVQALVRGPAP